MGTELNLGGKTDTTRQNKFLMGFVLVDAAKNGRARINKFCRSSSKGPVSEGVKGEGMR
jgi:hypothetical protein